MHSCAGVISQRFRAQVEPSAGPIIKLVETLSANAPERLQEFRQESDLIMSRFFRDNTVRRDYLLSRAVKSS
jgi:hypothetical protein